MARWLTPVLAFACWLLAGGGACAHDPSAYGGMFRSRNLGAVWLNADAGLFLNAALTVAVDPRDPNHLLMGTDLGLLGSRNGGRSWSPEAAELIIGAVFALAFSPDGQSVVCAAPSGVFRFHQGRWARAEASDGAVPARAVAFGAVPDRLYLLGRGGLFASVDGGAHFSTLPELPGGGEMTALAVARQPRETLLALVDGRLMVSGEGGRVWQRHTVVPGDIPLDTVVVDEAVPGRVWVAGGDRLFRSDDLGATWQGVGQPLPEPGTSMRGIAADPGGTTLVVTTHRGMYRSEDGGVSWVFRDANLPGHLEAGPLARDPSDLRTFYAVFSLMPYPLVWRTALTGSNLLTRVDPISLAGGIAFVLLLMLCGALLVGWLRRLRGTAPTPRRSPS